NKLRKKFEYYPDEVWKYLMRIQWGKIVDELSFQARSGKAGDEIGSYILATRTVDKIITLAFLMEKKYVPYSKWYGTAFKKLKISKRLVPLIHKIMKEQDWYKRQVYISKAYQQLADVHNKLKITKQINPKVEDFYGRGYPVVDAV